MNKEIILRNFRLLTFAMVSFAVAAVPSFGQTMYHLCASDGTVTMPDSTVVPIWGYADVTSSGDCTTGIATLPGPELRATAGETLTINVTNALTVPVSFFVPGLRAAATGGSAGMLTSEAAASGGTVTYEFAAVAGTRLYHSATDMRTQVPMGLYGALVVDVVADVAYGGVGYAQDEVLVFSEIDPNLNANPDTFGGARVINWNPQYFLINGAAYPVTADLTVDTSADVLLRLVNAGLETHFPTLEGGLYMDLVAEDGNLYPHRMLQYGVELPAAKTIDALVRIGADGTYALYDRGLRLTNGPAGGGGMLTYIQAGAVAGAPTAGDDGYATDEDTPLGVATPGVLDNDTAGAGLGPLEASLVNDVSAGVLTLHLDGSFTYTPNADFNGTDIFTYVANDGGPDSNVATVTITINPVDDDPVAAPDAYDAAEGQILNVAAPGVLANDTDVDGDTLTVNTTPVVAPTNGALTLYSDGSFGYTPSVPAPDTDSFTYEVCDNDLLTPPCASAVVTINVVTAPDNVSPFANDDFAEVIRNSVDFPINVTDNDVDADGTIDVTSVVITTLANTQRGGTVVNNGDGTVIYTPKRGFRGTDTFQYTVEDDPNGIPGDHDGLTSNEATVRINVVRP